MNEKQINILLKDNENEIIKKPHFYTLEDFNEIGKSICISLADQENLNCLTRLDCPLYTNLSFLKLKMGIQVMRQMPFRFDPELRKILKRLNYEGEELREAIEDAWKEINGIKEEERKFDEEEKNKGI